MKKVLFALWATAFALTVKAQILTEQVSSSTIASKVPGYSQVTTVNTVSLTFTPPAVPSSPTPVDADTATERSGTYKYGTLLSTNISLANGNYTTTSAGKVWTLRISISNALNIGLIFTNFLLSPAAEMYIYNDARTVLKNKIKKEHFTQSDTVSVSSLTGNAITVYIIEPGNTGTFQSNITIGKVIGGYRTISEVGNAGGGTVAISQSTTGTMGTMGATVNCIPHMMCYSQYSVSARAVARMSIPVTGGVGYCSGTLINNEQNNGRAYFLTAFHCIDDNKNNVIDAAEADAVRRATFQFQFWRTLCNGSVNNSGIEFNGATVRASSRASDIVLLELLNPPGIGDGVNYAGWNRQTATPSSSLSFVIHHPEAEDMRFTKVKNVRSYLFNSNYWQAK